MGTYWTMYWVGVCLAYGYMSTARIQYGKERFSLPMIAFFTVISWVTVGIALFNITYCLEKLAGTEEEE